MIEVYYLIAFLLSLVLTGIYAFIWHRHFSVFFTLIFAFVPVANMGYVFLIRAKNLDEDFLAYKIIYLGGCFLSLFIMLAILDLCNFRAQKWITGIFLIISTIVYLSVLTIGEYSFFYKDAVFKVKDGTPFVVNKHYVPFHTIFMIMILVYFMIPYFATLYSLIRKKDVSNKTVALLIVSEFLSVVGFFASKVASLDFELVPSTYIIAEIIFLIIMRKICMYSITDTGIDSIESSGDIGFVSFDKKLNYLGGSDIALIVFPELSTIKIDTPAASNEKVKEEIISRIEAFIENGDNDSFTKTMGNEIYRVSITKLYDAHKFRGYQLLIRNDTKEQNYIQLLNRFNESLEREVDLKTKHIVEMHDNLILSMATMVERRDNSTGGHIRRTSDVVSILVDEIKKDNELHLSDSFCKDLIKAAPMHDLGKIAVDDAILRKPGRFTPEEFEIMKTHAAEGGRIVHEILRATDDEDFKILAENVAHYHHERWDGSGYPEGLRGEEIPIEARIMAIADVYDALVSKRVYKERMSFEQADSIIMDGMGKHFDKRLEKYYVAARPKLEEYYTLSDAF